MAATEREITRCAIWGRVSTDDHKTANQLAELRSWAGRRDLEVAGRIRPRQRVRMNRQAPPAAAPGPRRRPARPLRCPARLGARPAVPRRRRGDALGHAPVRRPRGRCLVGSGVLDRDQRPAHPRADHRDHGVGRADGIPAPLRTHPAGLAGGRPKSSGAVPRSGSTSHRSTRRRAAARIGSKPRRCGASARCCGRKSPFPTLTAPWAHMDRGHVGRSQASHLQPRDRRVTQSISSRL
jgi:hypothetical protein